MKLAPIKPKAAWAVVDKRGNVLVDTINTIKKESIRAFVAPLGPDRNWSVTSEDDGFTVERVVIYGADDA